MDAIPMIRDMLYGPEGPTDDIGRDVMMSVSVACDRFGGDAIVDAVGMLGTAAETGLPGGRNTAAMVADGGEALRRGSGPDVSRFLLGAVLGAPYAFQSNDSVGGGAAAVSRLAGHGLRWTTRMLRRFLGYGNRIAEADAASGRRIHSNPGSCRALKEQVAEYAMANMNGDDVGDPAAYAGMLAEGMLRLYELEEPAAVASGAFSSPDLYLRWRRAVDGGAASPPACVSTLMGILLLFRNTPSYAKYPSSGFDGLMVHALESDGTRDYSVLKERLGIETTLTVRVDSPIGWGGCVVRADEVLGIHGSDTAARLLLVRDHDPRLLASLDFIDLINLACASLAPRRPTPLQYPAIRLDSRDLLDAVDLLSLGLPADMAAERLIAATTARMEG